MQAFLKQHRWVILAAGAAIQVLTGVPAAWGVFQSGVCEGYSLSQENAAMIFSLTICFFGIGCILGGLLQDKKGPRTAGLAGAVLLAAGFCGCGLHPGGKSVVLLRCVQHACGAGLCVFVSFGHVLRAEVVCGPQGPGHGRHWRRGGRVRARCSRFWAAFSSAPGASAPRSGCWAF